GLVRLRARGAQPAGAGVASAHRRPVRAGPRAHAPATGVVPRGTRRAERDRAWRQLRLAQGGRRPGRPRVRAPADRVDPGHRPGRDGLLHGRRIPVARQRLRRRAQRQATAADRAGARAGRPRRVARACIGAAVHRRGRPHPRRGDGTRWASVPHHQQPRRSRRAVRGRRPASPSDWSPAL
ncbi:MAG: hypothetical protein AVDCRST_MAG89-1096, partial [uncultured Gemmatimonadetes bacterium]